MVDDEALGLQQDTEPTPEKPKTEGEDEEE